MPFEASKNGRGGLLALRAHENGEGQTSVRVAEAKSKIENPGTWKGEFGNKEMDQLIATLDVNYLELEKNGRRFAPRDKIDNLVKNMNIPENHVMRVEISTMYAMYGDNWEAAKAHMKEAIIRHYPNANKNTSSFGNRSRGGQRRIGKATTIHGVRIKDLDNITDTEWNSLPSQGKAEAAKQRRQYRQQRDGGGRSGRGGYNKGRNYRGHRNYGGGRGRGRGGGRGYGGRGRGRGGYGGRGGGRGYGYGGGGNNNNNNNGGDRNASEINSQNNEQRPDEQGSNQTGNDHSQSTSNRGGRHGNNFGRGTHR